MPDSIEREGAGAARPLPRVVLASASPRRKELLAAAGIACEVFPSEVEEVMRPGESAAQFALRMAVEKAEDVAARRSGETAPIVAADTVVVLDEPAGAVNGVQEAVLGKPESAADAMRMLRRLSGRTHRVLTGICVLNPVSSERQSEVVSTEVRFAGMTEQEIRGYVATGEPVDKAGAYGIQGIASRFVERIDGCYFNVVGLPVPALYRMLLKLRSM